MKSFVKLSLSLFIVICLVSSTIGVLAFEQVNNNEDPLKVNVFAFHDFKSMPDDSNYMRQWILKNRNIDFNFTYISEKQDDRMNMMLASGDVPDVCLIPTGDSSLGIMNKWAEAGLIIPLDSWLKKYPEILKYTNAQYNNAVYTVKKDKKMYLIPANPAGNPKTIELNVGPIIREDWLKKIGKPAPKTTDELYTVLKLFKEKIGKVDGKEIIPASFNAFRQFFAYTFTSNWYKVYPKNSKIDFFWQMPEINDYTAYMNKLYKGGLLDKEVITQKDDMFFAKLNSGRVGFSVVVTPWLDAANNAIRVKDKKARFIPCPEIRVPGKNPPMMQTTTPQMYAGLTISTKFASNANNVKRLMEFLSWNATAEGAFTLQCGPIGVYKKLDSVSGNWVDKPEVTAAKLEANSTFRQKSGVEYYNLLFYPTIPLNVDKGLTAEVAMAQTVWKEGMQPTNVYFDMSPWGPIFNAKWGTLWGELAKWEAKTIYAKSDSEYKKASQDMFNYYEKNGGRDIANEKLKLYKDFLVKMGIK